MHRLFPDPGPLDEADLERLYAFPDTDRPWVCVNFVSSVDGAVSVEGRSAGLSDDADRTVFLLDRTLSDVVLVGAGTARAENYGGVKVNARRAAQRERAGLTGVPPVAVVTGRCDLDPDARLFTDTRVPPIVFTTTASPQERRDALTEVADVVLAGDQRVEPKLVLAELARRKLHRVACEGGPHLFGALVTAGAVDEVRLTLSAQLCSGDALRIAAGPAAESPVPLELASVVRAEHTLLLRYVASR